MTFESCQKYGTIFCSMGQGLFSRVSIYKEREFLQNKKGLMVNAMVLVLIEEKRQQMIELAMTLGFTAKETIQCSQELDELINRYLQQTVLTPLPSAPVPQ
jgi:stage 0 sporulation regulatory protein